MDAKKNIVAYLLIFFSFSFLYIFFFHLFPFKKGEVLFYKGVYLLILASIILSLSLLLLNRRLKLRVDVIILALLCAFSLNLTFFVIFPVTFERSVTMFLLHSLAEGRENGVCVKGKKKDELRKNLIDKYVTRKDAVGKRVVEQLELGTIKRDDKSCIFLSFRGKRLLDFARWIEKIYNIPLR